MSRNQVVGLLLVSGLVVVIALAACSSGPTPVPPAAMDPGSLPAPVPTVLPTLAPTPVPTADGATLLETRCSVCHSPDRAKQVRLTKDQWDQLVSIMIANGAQLTAAEKSVLVDYLAKTYGP